MFFTLVRLRTTLFRYLFYTTSCDSSADRAQKSLWTWLLRCLGKSRPSLSAIGTTLGQLFLNTPYWVLRSKNDRMPCFQILAPHVLCNTISVLTIGWCWLSRYRVNPYVGVRGLNHGGFGLFVDCSFLPQESPFAWFWQWCPADRTRWFVSMSNFPLQLLLSLDAWKVGSYSNFWSVRLLFWWLWFLKMSMVFVSAALISMPLHFFLLQIKFGRCLDEFAVRAIIPAQPNYT